MPPSGAKPTKDPGVLAFDAQVLKGDKTSCRLVQFPYSAEEVFGRKGVVDVRVSFNGVQSPGPLYNPGKGRPHFLLIRKELREKLGVDGGDTVHVTVRGAGCSSTAVNKDAVLITAAASSSAASEGDELTASVKRKPVTKRSGTKRKRGTESASGTVTVDGSGSGYGSS